MFMQYPSGQQQTAEIPTGKYCSSYTAEVAALIITTGVKNSTSDQYPQVVFLTDVLFIN